MVVDGRTPGEELASVPFGDLIHAVATAVADGQFQLDKSSMRVAEFMGGHALLRDLDTGQLLTREGQVTQEPEFVDTRVYFGYTYDEKGVRRANEVSMMELGFVPTFYQFVDTVIELKIAVRLRKAELSDEATSGVPTPRGLALSPTSARGKRGLSRAIVTATPIDARYMSSYNYSADMTSKVSTKLVPVPPPPMLEERIRRLIEQEMADRDRQASALKERESRSLSAQPLGGPAFDMACYRVGEVGLAKQLVTQALTVEAWVAPKAFQHRDGLVGAFLDQGTSAKGWLLGVFDGRFGFALSASGGVTVTVIKAPVDYAPEKWHHVAGVYDGAKMRLYLDGQLQKGSTEQHGALVYPDTGWFAIGAYPYPDGLTPFSGKVDEVRLWDRALDGNRIKRDMDFRLQGREQGLVGYWRLDKSHDDVVPDVIAGRDAKKATLLFTEPKKGRTFGAPIDCGSIALNDRSFTTEFWAKRKLKDAMMTAVFHGKPSNNQGIFCGFRAANVFTFAFYANDLDTGKAYPETGEWHHWACVYDHAQGNRVIYRDGEQVASDKSKGSYAGSGALVIGALQNGADKFGGEIAEVRIWDVARSQEQIRRTKNLHLTGKEKGLVLYRGLQDDA